MPHTKRVSIIIIVLLIVLIIYFLLFPKQVVNESPPEDMALKAAVISCDGITERAASHLVAIVDFQKLEIAGRKARVFKLCMQDRGYYENKNWLAYSMPLAKSAASEAKISVDEALENLRRVNMIVPYGEQARPSYWVKKERTSS